jgi:hypothetical protein
MGITDENNNFIKIAYAIGLSMNVSVNVQPVNVIGNFGPVSYEPTMYNPVTGTFQIVRLQNKAFKDARIARAKTLYAGSKIIDPNQIDTQIRESDNNILTQSNLSDHLTPERILLSSTFDIDVYLNINDTGNNTNSAAINKFNDVNQRSRDAIITRWLRIKDCRLVSRNVNIASGSLINEPLNWLGLLAMQQNGLDLQGAGSDLQSLDSNIQEKATA